MFLFSCRDIRCVLLHCTRCPRLVLFAKAARFCDARQRLSFYASPEDCARWAKKGRRNNGRINEEPEIGTRPTCARAADLPRSQRRGQGRTPELRFLRARDKPGYFIIHRGQTARDICRVQTWPVCARQTSTPRDGKATDSPAHAHVSMADLTVPPKRNNNENFKGFWNMQCRYIYKQLNQTAARSCNRVASSSYRRYI